MYIPYDKVGATLALFAPIKARKNIRDFFNELKIQSNCNYIKKNVKKVQKKLSTEIKHRKLRVGFYIYDETKWKCQTLYDIFKDSDEFTPVILATKNCSPKSNFNFQKPETIKKIYEFFKNKSMNVEYAYDFDKDCYIPFEKFNLDIIFYQHPWYIETSQGPVVCSKFALTYYVPYYLPSTTFPQDYYLRFHRYIHKYCVLNQELVDRYSSLMANKGENLLPIGTPQLDYFYLDKNSNQERKYLIYAPHWSVNHVNTIAYSTFLWSGKIILEYARKHPELNWIFKPHPCLKSSLITNGYWSEKEVDDYYKEWDKIGMRYESGDYLDLFQQSYAMITDCGTFLTEFFLTKMPVIHLVTPDSVPFIDHINKISATYYHAQNEDELEKYFNEVIINKNDYMKEKRLELLEELDFANNYSALNIYNYIKQELGVKE